MMRRILYNLIPVLVPLVILALAGWRLISERGEWVRQQLPHVLRSELWARTGRAVRVGFVKGDLLRGITVHDIAIAEPEGFGAGEALAAEQIRIRYNLAKLLTGKSGPLASIRELTIVGPAISATRDRDGTIDIVAMFAPKRPRPPSKDRVMVPVQVRGAKLAYTDMALRTRDRRPLVVHLEDVNGTVDISRPGRTSVSMGGMNTDGLARELDADVEYVSSPRSFSVNARIEGAAIRRLADMVPVELPVRIETGSADVRGTVYGVRGADKQWETGYNLGADISGARVAVPQIGGERLALSGRMRLTPETLVIPHAAATAAFGRATVSGAVFDLLHEPYLALRVEAEGVDVGEAMAHFELPDSVPSFAVHGDAAADVAIGGCLPHVRVSGTVRLPGGHVTDEERGLGGFLVGPVEAAVDIDDWAEPHVAVDAHLSSVSTGTQSGAVWQVVPLELGEVEAGSARASVTWSRAEGLEVAGTLEGLAAPEASLSGGHCSFQATGDRVAFDATAAVLAGSARAGGTYERPPAGAGPGSEAGGTLRLAGRVAAVDAAACAALPWRARARARPEGGDDSAEEKRGGYKAALAKVQAGRVTADFALTYDGTAAACQLVANTTGLQYDGERLPDGDMTATVAAHRAEQDDATVWRVADGQVSVHARDDRGDAWLAAELGAGGEASRKGTGATAVRARFGGTGTDVQAIGALLGQDEMSGRARASGWVRAAWEQGTNEWRVEDSSAALHVEAPTFRQHALDFLELELAGNLDHLAVRHARGVRGGSEITADGAVERIDLEKKDAALALHAVTRGSSLGDWLAVTNVGRASTSPLQEADGTCSAWVDIGGRLSSPCVSGHVRVVDATAYEQPIEDVQAVFEYADDSVRLTGLRLRSGDATVRGEAIVANLAETPRIDAHLEATGIDVSRVPAVADADLPIRAVLGARGDVEVALADPRNPQVSATMVVAGEDVAVAGQRVWDLTAAVAYAGDTVALRGATCEVFGGTLRATGAYGVKQRRLGFDASSDAFGGPLAAWGSYRVADGGLELGASVDGARTWLLAEAAARCMGELGSDPSTLRTIGKRLHAHVTGDVRVHGTAKHITGGGQLSLDRVTLDKLYVPDVGNFEFSFAQDGGEKKRVLVASIQDLSLGEANNQLTVSGDIRLTRRPPERSRPPEVEPVRVAWLPPWPIGVAAEPPGNAQAAEPSDVQVNLRARGRNVDLAWLDRWLPVEVGLRGSTRFDATMRGSAREPSITVQDLRIDDPSLHELALGTITLDSFELAGGEAHLRNLVLSVGGPRIQVRSADAPFDWGPLDVPDDLTGPLARSEWLAQHVRPDGDVFLEARLYHADAGIFLPLIDSARAVARRLRAQQDKQEPSSPPSPEPLETPRIAEKVELTGDIQGSVAIAGKARQPVLTSGRVELDHLHVGVRDGGAIADDVRGALVYEPEGNGEPSRVALEGFSADMRGLRVIPSGHVEAARLLTDGIAMVPLRISFQLLGRSVILGDPWAGARVLTTLPRQWRYQRDPGDVGVAGRWFGTDLDDAHWQELPTGVGGAHVDEAGTIWYRTRFRAPRKAADKLLAIAFESMMHQAELYVNGQTVGRFVPRVPRPEAERGSAGAAVPRAEDAPRGAAPEEVPLARRWAVEVTDHVMPGQENVVALRVAARKGPLPLPGIARLGEVRGLVLRSIAGVVTAERKSLGDPLLIRPAGVLSDGVDARHVSAQIGQGKVQLWGGIDVASDRFSLDQLDKNHFDLSLEVDAITPRYAPYLLGGRVLADRPIRFRTGEQGRPFRVQGRVRLEHARVSLPAAGRTGGAGVLTSLPTRYPQPEFNLALDIGRDVHFVTPPLYLSSIGSNGEGIPLAINAPLPLRERRNALMVEGTPREPHVKLDTEVAHKVQFSPPGGGAISIRRAAVGFDLRPEPGTREQEAGAADQEGKFKEGLPLVGRILASIEGVRNIDGGSFSFILVSPDYRRAHPEVLSEYEEVLAPVEGRATGAVEEQTESWILACRPAAIGDRGTRELLLLAFWPFGRVVREGGPGAGEVALAWATERAVGRLEKQVLRPIEELLVESGLVDRATIEGVVAGAPSFQVGKDIIDNLYVTYQRQLTTRQQEGLQVPFLFTAGYRVRDRYEVSFTTDERRDQRVAVEYRVPF